VSVCLIGQRLTVYPRSLYTRFKKTGHFSLCSNFVHGPNVCQMSTDLYSYDVLL